jgi:hypothetical protein
MAEQKDTVDKTEGSNQESQKQERSPRALDSREAAQRVQSWENPTNLPDPVPQEGWVFRWIRTATLGNNDNTNVSRRFREGWEPSRLEDHPELQNQMMDHNSEWAKKGNIEIGGQLLCKMPKEIAEARNEHFNNIAKTQMESVDNIYFKENDPRMPKGVFERKSRTSFGKDS